MSLKPGTNGPDYFSHLAAPPPSLVDAQGQYLPGWFNHYDAAPNVENSEAPARRLQYWFHLHCASRTHYVSANIAQMGPVGNVSLFVIHKNTGECIHSSEKMWLWRNQIKQTGGCALIWDPISGSSVCQDRTGTIQFNIRTSQGSFIGSAEPSLGPAFVQSTPYPSGYGSLQWWGPTRLLDGHLEYGTESIRFAPGEMGGFDRTIGHRYRKQHWNWLSAEGHASSAIGSKVPFALQMAVDNLRSPLLPDPKKYNLWIHNQLLKFDKVIFSKGNTWTIEASGDGAAERLNLSFEPSWVREEKSGHTAILGGHFRQFFGALSGTAQIRGSRYNIDVPFALLEDSQLNL